MSIKSLISFATISLIPLAFLVACAESPAATPSPTPMDTSTPPTVIATPVPSPAEKPPLSLKTAFSFGLEAPTEVQAGQPITILTKSRNIYGEQIRVWFPGDVRATDITI
jgi:hypothetical protein